MKRYLLSLVVFSFLVLFSSCSDNSSSASDDNGIVKVPKVGSSYVLQTTFMDSLGTVTSTQIDTFFLAKRKVSAYGRDQVIHYANGSDGRGDSIYMALESNGDVALYQTKALDVFAGFAPQWMTVPTETHKEMLYTFDTTFEDKSIHTEVKYAYEGSSAVSIGGKSVMVHRVKESMVSTGLNGGFPFNREYESAWYSFAPELGYFTKMEYPYQSGKTIRFIPHEVKLIAFDLK